MIDRELTIHVPGKLVLMGEYAVLLKDSQGLVAAVDRYIRIEAKGGHHFGEIRSELSFDPVRWYIKDGQLFFDKEPKGSDLICEAIRWGIMDLLECGVQPQIIDIEVKSELFDHASQIGYGLGSSAALTVGIITTLLLYGLGKNQIDKELRKRIFQLSLLAHYSGQGNGSGIDVAASVYGGVLLYRSTDLKRLVTDKDLLISEKRAYIEKNIKVEAAIWPQSVKMAVGWTGMKASSRYFVDCFLRNQEEAFVEEFIRRSNWLVNLFKSAMITDDADHVLKIIAKQRQALLLLEDFLRIQLETVELKRLCNYFEIVGKAKFSGAGSGDCGIGFYKKTQENVLPKVYRQWKEFGIVPLNISMSKEGVRVSKTVF